jgi:hypothetical protein
MEELMTNAEFNARVNSVKMHTSETQRNDDGNRYDQYNRLHHNRSQ